MSATSRLTILLSGMIAGDPGHGGATWAVLQYLLGLRQLGHDVYFVEPINPASVRPAGSPFSESHNAAYFRKVVEQFGLTDSAALLLRDSRTTVGLSYDAVREVARRTDVLINISGMLTDCTLIEPIPTRVYLDLDPAFIQLWHAQGTDMRFDAHTHFVTVGQGIGQASCPVPTCGRAWIGTAQPVVLSQWPVAAEIRHNALTTVGSWRGYGSVEHQGIHYGQKAHSLRQFIDLPMQTPEPFVLAMGIHRDETKDLEALARNRWRLLDPADVAATPNEYRRFVQQSKAEFGVAKSGYVASRCQWFSDRSAVYLASGRPVVAQNTGFDQWLPTGRGLFAFETASDVCAAIDAINADYAGHSAAARQIAVEYFDSDKVLSRLLAKVGAA